MMIKRLCALFSFICLLAQCHVTPDPEEHLYPHIQKIDDELYFSKMKDHDLYLAMERVTEKNIRYWKQYAEVQGNPRVSGYVAALVNPDGSKKQKGSTSDGANHFFNVLTETPLHLNEIWITYITDNKKPQHIPGDMIFYSGPATPDNEENPAFARSIKMFVTVTSSPEALLTSHMGVAASAEGVEGNRPKGISIPLHSFGAKVMLLRNPKRRFMMTAPVFAMEQILAKALPPHSVFVGTREMRKEMEERQSISFDQFMERNPGLREEVIRNFNPHVMKEEREDWAEKCEELNKKLSEELRDKLSHMSEEEIRRKIAKSAEKYPLKIGDDGLFVISEDKLKEKIIRRELGNEFDNFRRPFWFEPASSRNSVEFLRLMEKYPPLLSVDNDMTRIKKEFTVYERDNPHKAWLHVEKGNPHYKWLFTSPFLPAGGTHYVLVDLRVLADATPADVL